MTTILLWLSVLIAGRLLTNEILGLMSRLSRFLVECGVRRLPESLRDERREEWLANLEYEGRDGKKLSELRAGLEAWLGAGRTAAELEAEAAEVEIDKRAGDSSSEQLFVRMAARDETALNELYIRYAPYLAAVVVRILKDQVNAQRCVQDIFFRAWETAKYRDTKRVDVKTWLTMLAHRVSFDHLRKQQFPLLEHPLKLIGLEDAMAELDNDERELVELAFYRGYSHQELADLTGTPLGIIKNKLRAALYKLRACLEEV